MTAACRLGGWRRDRNDDAGGDRTHLEAVRARLARIKAHRAKRQVEELQQRWPDGVNILESLLLQRRFQDSKEQHDVE